MQLLYFAWVREKVGTGEEEKDIPAHVKNVEELLDWLSSLGDNYTQAFADKNRLRVAIDQNHAGLEDAISGAYEIAIFPPVTGG